MSSDTISTIVLSRLRRGGLRAAGGSHASGFKGHFSRRTSNTQVLLSPTTYRPRYWGPAPYVITLLISLKDLDFILAYYLMLAAAMAIIPNLLIEGIANKTLAGSRSQFVIVNANATPPPGGTGMPGLLS